MRFHRVGVFCVDFVVRPCVGRGFADAHPVQQLRPPALFPHDWTQLSRVFVQVPGVSSLPAPWVFCRDTELCNKAPAWLKAFLTVTDTSVVWVGGWNKPSMSGTELCGHSPPFPFSNVSITFPEFSLRSESSATACPDIERFASREKTSDGDLCEAPFLSRCDLSLPKMDHMCIIAIEWAT